MIPGFYLAKLDANGRIDPFNLDGPHSNESGVARAKYLLRALGLAGPNATYVMIEVLETPLECSEGVDHDAVSEMAEIALTSSRKEKKT